MPGFRQFLIVLILSGFAMSSARAKEYQCSYEKRFRDGSSTGASLKLGIARGKINKLVVYSLISSGEAGSGYLCGIDTSEQGQDAKWSTRNRKTILDMSGSVIEIEPIGLAYKVNLENASRDGCGFGAEWPLYLVIEPGNSRCRVKN